MTNMLMFLNKYTFQQKLKRVTLDQEEEGRRKRKKDKWEFQTHPNRVPICMGLRPLLPSVPRRKRIIVFPLPLPSDS